MRYFKTYKEDGKTFEITYDEALDVVLGTYRDCDMTRDMLLILNRIDCMYSVIFSRTEDTYPLVLMPGVYNLIPDDVSYDNDGNHIK